MPKRCGSSPMLAIHSDNNRAYCLVVMHCPRPRDAVNKEFAGLLAGCSDVAVHGMTCLLRQFKPDGSPGLFLPDGRPIGGIAIRRNVLDLEGDTSQPRNLLSTLDNFVGDLDFDGLDIAHHVLVLRLASPRVYSRSYERFAWSAARRPSMASRTASRACSTDAMA